MLYYDQIKSNYPATQAARFPRNILVEYLQYEILDSIFKQKGSEHLSFIGGTAIRIVFASQRFSEDLDFDNFGLSFEDFEKILKKAVYDMELKGFSAEFRFVEKGAYHCYVKFPEILKQSNLPHGPDEKILIRIDTVRKEKSIEPQKILIEKFDVYRQILANPAGVILSQKLLAIIQRKREKGRDFYDVSFLFGRTEPDYEYIKKQFGYSKEDFIKALKSRISDLDMHELAKDVEPFLINPDDTRRVEGFKEYIGMKLK